MSKVNVFKIGPFFIWIYGPLLDNASWGVWWSFFQLWLTSESNGLGLSGSAVGTVFSANSLVTLILRAWGSFGYALVALLAGFLFVKILI
ncbi:hypothetical protein EfmAA94_31460 (plasmid) [Enterococcus faecium]|nr:hypothetical protein EfmAA94_31460 [Enterococcus faecium]